MEIKGTFHSLSKDYKTNKWLITFESESLEPSLLDELKDKVLTIIANVFRKKKSLESNRYFWRLANELAKRLSNQDHTVKPIDIYRNYIPNIPCVSEDICIKTEAVDEFERLWCKGHDGRMVDRYPSKLQGYTRVVAYKGASDYDQQQMNMLINLIVEDCKEQGIETMTPAEIERMMQLWKA